MKLSSNSLFHFTGNIESIKAILLDKFYGSYCKETLVYKTQQVPMIIPMICFCDIRLETITRYSNYGKYGIGIKKEWGVKNKLNPVFYLEKDSLLAESLISTIYKSLPNVLVSQVKLKQIEEKIKQTQRPGQRSGQTQQIILQRLKNELAVLKSTASPLEHFIYSLYYTKHYETDLIRENVIVKDYRFYDEREWRYLPQFDCAVCELRRTEEEYQKWRATSLTKPLLKEISLSFEFSDIEHIIVEKESEVKEIIKLIKELDTTLCSDEQKDLLLTKISSFEKIENDY